MLFYSILIKGDNMRIGIDIDGVLTDIEHWQLDYGSKFFFETYGKEIIDFDKYETNEIFKVRKQLNLYYYCKGKFFITFSYNEF